MRKLYLSHEYGDIIVINNSKQSTIFIGKYNFEAKIYDIEYILEFINENYLKNELNKLPNRVLKIYLKSITIFNEKNSNDYISPIIDNNEILGSCYKYNPNFTDYSSCINYIEYLQNDKIKYSVILHFNYLKINQKISDIYEINEDEYYLINHSLMQKMKKSFNYDKIIEMLQENKEINIFEDENDYMKKLISVIKSLSVDILRNNTTIIEPENNDYQELLHELDLLQVQYTDKMMNARNLIKIKKLYKNQVENISCVSLSNDVLNFSVGDYQLIHCEKISSFIGNDLKNAYKFKQINNYLSEKNHSEFCETAQCFMTKNNFLIIYSYYSDFTWPLKFNQVKYENKNLSNFEVIKGNIYMSNFNVPFDFDGDKYIYLEHYNKEIRCINIYSTIKDQKIFQIFLENDFGHISFIKLLPDNCIFLCRKIYIY